MWISKKERKLLKYYYSIIGNKYNAREDLDRKRLIETTKLLDRWPYSHYSKNIVVRRELDFMEKGEYEVVDSINKHLEKKELIEIGVSSTGMVQDSGGSCVYSMGCVSLTTKGFDLAQKYDHWFSRWSLWGKEHKCNPLWMIIFSIIGGIIGTVITMIKTMGWAAFFALL